MPSGVWNVRLALALLGLAGFVLLAWTGEAEAQARAKVELDDDTFLESLATADSRSPVDRRRLAKLFFSIAATLEGGKSSVRLLQAEVVVPATTRRTARDRLEAQFEGYTSALAGFQRSVSSLLDDAQSSLRSYRVLMAGQHACWQLDLHNRMLDSYGVGSTKLGPILSSLEACARFRSAAFRPTVQAIVADALVEAARQRRQLVDLQDEVRELERLVEDLHRIDAGE